MLCKRSRECQAAPKTKHSKHTTTSSATQTSECSVPTQYRAVEVVVAVAETEEWGERRGGGGDVGGDVAAEG
eukprot:2482655-Rhodomonas_salina.1